MANQAALHALARLQSSSGSSVDFSTDTDGSQLLALIRAAVDHGLVALLGRCVNESRLQAVPESISRDLVRAAALNERRNQQFREELLELLAVCQQLGIAPVLLKSTAALMASSPYVLTDRFMGDLDILLSEPDIATLAKALRDRGYACEPGGEADSPVLKHYPRLIAPGRIAPIEIHRNLAEAAWQDILPGREGVRDACPVASGSEALQLSLADRIVHAFVHDQLDNRGWWHARVELRGAYAVVRELLEADAKVDWLAIESRLARQHLLKRFRVWLSWLATLYPQLVPVLPFVPDTDAFRYERAAEKGPLFWRSMLADVWAELEQLSRSASYRQRAWQRAFTAAAYRERWRRLLARRRHAVISRI